MVDTHSLSILLPVAAGVLAALAALILRPQPVKVPVPAKARRTRR